MRYRLSVATASLVFFLTGPEKLRLRVGSPVGQPSLFRTRGLRPAQAFEGQGSAPKQALVARAQAEAGIGCGQSVLIIGETAVGPRKASPSAPVEGGGFGDSLIRLGSLFPSPGAGVRVTPDPIAHRVRSDQRFVPLGELNGFHRSSPNRRESAA